MTIDTYLLELRRLLPPYARVRALPEIREHLRDAAGRNRATGASPADAEVAATAEFGAVEVVARRLRSELAVRETRLAAALAVGAAAFFVFPLYVVPENSLPPAAWVEKPYDIAALQRIAIGLWLAAGMLAAASALIAWTRWSRLTWPALLGAVVALTGSVSVSVALVVRWFSYTASTPNFALAVPLALGCLAICAVAAFWSLSSSRRLRLVED